MQKTFFKNKYFNTLFTVIIISILLLVAIKLINMDKFILGGGRFEYKFGEVCSDVVGYANLIGTIAAIILKVKKKIQKSELFTCLPLNLIVLFVNLMFSLDRVF